MPAKCAQTLCHVFASQVVQHLCAARCLVTRLKRAVPFLFSIPSSLKIRIIVSAQGICSFKLHFLNALAPSTASSIRLSKYSAGQKNKLQSSYDNSHDTDPRYHCAIIFPTAPNLLAERSLILWCYTYLALLAVFKFASPAWLDTRFSNEYNVDMIKNILPPSQGSIRSEMNTMRKLSGRESEGWG